MARPDENVPPAGRGICSTDFHSLRRGSVPVDIRVRKYLLINVEDSPVASEDLTINMFIASNYSKSILKMVENFDIFSALTGARLCRVQSSGILIEDIFIIYSYPGKYIICFHQFLMLERMDFKIVFIFLDFLFN